MRLLQILTFWSLFISRAFSLSLLDRLLTLQLNGFLGMLNDSNPALLAEIDKRNDITVWAPGNAAVAARLAAVRKRRPGGGASTSAQVDHTKPPGRKGLPSKRQVGEGPEGYPDTNFETIITYLTDPEFVNLGPGEGVRFTKNYAAPRSGSGSDLSGIEVATGLGTIRHTIRGPYKFTNGVIYEVNDFFTLPEPFSATMKYINIAQQFYNSIVSRGKLRVFEKTTAVTIFAPIDSNSTYSNRTNPYAHIITGPQSLYYSSFLIPGNNLVAKSGDIIKITWAPNGERLVNCRHLVKPNVPIKNGVIHFIDGPLFGGGGCHRNTTQITSKPPGPTCT